MRRLRRPQRISEPKDPKLRRWTPASERFVPRLAFPHKPLTTFTVLHIYVSRMHGACSHKTLDTMV